MDCPCSLWPPEHPTHHQSLQSQSDLCLSQLIQAAKRKKSKCANVHGWKDMEDIPKQGRRKHLKLGGAQQFNSRALFSLSNGALSDPVVKMTQMSSLFVQYRPEARGGALSPEEAIYQTNFF